MTLTVFNNMLSMEHLLFSLSIPKVKRYRFFSLIETGDKRELSREVEAGGTVAVVSNAEAGPHSTEEQPRRAFHQGRCLPLGNHPTQLPNRRVPTQ